MPKQSQRVRGDIQNEGRRVNTEHDDLLQMLQGQVPGAQNRANDAYNAAFGGYNRFLNRPSSGGFGDYYREFAGPGGGLSDENVRRIRGNGVFDEFSRGGGLSDEDISMLRASGNRTVPSFYNAVRDRFGTQKLIGGGGPAYTASQSRIARDASRATADAALNAESNIIDTRNKGRMWGTEGLSGAERSLADLISSNRKFGIEGGSNNDYRNNALNLEALAGLRGLRTDTPGEEFGLYDRLLNTIGQRGNLSAGNLQQRANYDPNVSWFDRLMKIWQTGQQGLGAAGRIVRGIG